jgi:hypothetical protein
MAKDVSETTKAMRHTAAASRVGSAAGPCRCHATVASSLALAIAVTDAPKLEVDQVLAMEHIGRWPEAPP